MSSPSPLPGVGVDVLPARPEDVPELAALAARTFPDACPPELPDQAIRAFVRRNLSETAFQEHLGDPDHAVRVLRSPDGRMVAYAVLVAGTDMDPGCADLVQGRPTAGVSKFYVDATNRGAGTADALLDALVAESRRRGLASLWLATNVANERARRFYVRRGFVERGGRTFVVGDVDNTDVVYELALDDA